MAVVRSSSTSSGEAFQLLLAWCAGDESALSNDKRKSSVVELRYFGGLTVDEIAQLLGVYPITDKRDWSMAKAWLYRQISRERDT
jgi:hypothetical protein